MIDYLQEKCYSQKCPSETTQCAATSVGNPCTADKCMQGRLVTRTLTEFARPIFYMV